MNWLNPERLLLLAGAVSLLWMAFEYRQHKRRTGIAVLAGAGSGMALLLALHLYGHAPEWMLPLNAGTAAVAAVLGIPGVMLLLLLQYLAIS